MRILFSAVCLRFVLRRIVLMVASALAFSFAFVPIFLLLLVYNGVESLLYFIPSFCPSGPDVKQVSLQSTKKIHIENLDSALAIISKISVLYKKLERSKQQQLLRHLVKRVIVNPEGKIIDLELLSPFAYLRDVTARVEQKEQAGIDEKTNVSTMADTCSTSIQLGTPSWIRTSAFASGGQRSIP